MHCTTAHSPGTALGHSPLHQNPRYSRTHSPPTSQLHESQLIESPNQPSDCSPAILNIGFAALFHIDIEFFFQIIANGLVTHKVASNSPIDAHLFQAFSGVISLSTANIIIFALENSEIILHFTRQ